MSLVPSRRQARALTWCALTLGTAALVTFAACSSDDSTSPDAAHELDGPAVSVGNGTAQAYVVTSPNGTSSIGVALTANALNGLPSTDSEWSLPLPAGTSVAPFDHVVLNWNAQGHPPMQYMEPHFDFHFYTITPAAQAAIVGGPDNTPVPAANVPKDYVSGVVAVPDMGVHWVDTTSSEFEGHMFDRTMIYGFYHGGMVFIEPMITRVFLATQPNVSAGVKQPASFAQHGSYPLSYSVHTDAATQTIRVSLDSLVSR